MELHQQLNQDSGETEYYTEPFVIEAAREVMGSIDLDPASCDYANQEHVKADVYFTQKDDGLKCKWFGNVWMNHPFSKGENPCPKDRLKCKKKACNDPFYSKYRGHCIDDRIPSNGDWVDKLISEYQAGNIEQSCNITFGATSEIWFQLLAQYPQCSLSPRTNYYKRNGKKLQGITKGSVVTYLGSNVEKFNAVFSPLGSVHLPYGYHR